MAMPAEIGHELALDVNEYAISQLATALANWLVDPSFKDFAAIVDNHTEDILPVLYAVGSYAARRGYEAVIEDHEANALQRTVVNSPLLDAHGNEYLNVVPERSATPTSRTTSPGTDGNANSPSAPNLAEGENANSVG